MEQYKNEQLNKLWNRSHSQRVCNIDRLIERMQESLGEYYDELYEFFLDVMRQKYDYKFLIARRCLVLYQIYQRIFEYNQENIWVDGEVLSDRIVAKLRKNLKGKKILLIDDIFIHGRRIETLYNDLRKNCADEDIDVKVYMVTTDKKCISEELAQKIYYTEFAEEWKWKTLSNAIVEAIYASNIPYTSFVSAYTVTNQSKVVLYHKTKSLVNESLGQKKMGCISTVLFDKEKRAELFEVFSYVECIREYQSKVCQNTLLIPYAFTKSIKRKSINDFFEKFTQHIKCLPQIANELRSTDDESDMWNTYRLNLWSALLCKLVGVYRSVNEMEGYEDYDTIVKAFGEEIAIELVNINKEQCAIILNQSYAELKQYVCDNMQDDERLLRKYCENLQQEKRYEDGYKKYLSYNRSIDEERAINNEPRLGGISVDSAIKVAEEIGKISIEEIAKDILNSMDTGCASVSYGCMEKEKNYASMILTGEQSYRIFLESYAEIIRNIVYLEDGDMDSKDYILQLGMENIINERQKNELLEFQLKYRGRMEECNVTSIIEDRRFWNIPGIGEFHKQYLKTHEYVK